MPVSGHVPWLKGLSQLVNAEFLELKILDLNTAPACQWLKNVPSHPLLIFLSISKWLSSKILSLFFQLTRQKSLFKKSYFTHWDLWSVNFHTSGARQVQWRPCAPIMVNLPCFSIFFTLTNKIQDMMTLYYQLCWMIFSFLLPTTRWNVLRCQRWKSIRSVLGHIQYWFCRLWILWPSSLWCVPLTWHGWKMEKQVWWRCMAR